MGGRPGASSTEGGRGRTKRILDMKVRTWAIVALATGVIFEVSGLVSTASGWIGSDHAWAGRLLLLAPLAVLAAGGIAHHQHRSATAALQAAEGQFQHLPVPATMWERSGDDFVLARANDLTIQLTHGHIDELMGKRFRDLYGDRPEIADVFDEAVTSGGVVLIETDHQMLSTGEVKHFEGYISHTSPNTITVISLDVTQQHQTRMQLAAEKRRFEAMIEHAPDSLVVIGPEREIVYMSPNTKDLFGSDISGFGTHARGERVHPDDRLVMETALLKAVQEPGQPSNYRLRVQHKDGRWLWVEATAISHISDPAIGGVVVHFRDVTEEHEANEERNRALAELEALHDFLPVGVVVVERSGKFAKINQKFSELIGLTKEELFSTTAWELANLIDMHPVGVGERGDLLGYFAETGTLPLSEMSIQPLDGTPRRRIMASVAPLPTTAERDLSLAVFVDVTDERSLAERLHRAQKLEAVGRLAGGIAHDFNNLLLVVSNYLYLLRQQTVLDRRSESDADQAERAIQRATSLIRQLLTFSRGTPTSPQSLDMNEAVKDLSDMLTRVVGEGITIETSLEPDLWPTLIDPSNAEQIIMNLVVNAREAMEGGGDLTITTSNDVVLKGQNIGLEPGEYVCLQVSDSGHGITEGTQDNMFDPFFTTREEHGNSGLGLATIHGIIEGAGGAIKVDSELGRGTTFSIFLPRSTETARAIEHPTSIHPPMGSGRSILVVEDDHSVLRLIERVLKDSGYEVQALPSATAAREVCSAHETFDLLLTDLILPGATGVELARELSGTGHVRNVLMMSGYIDGHGQEGPFKDVMLKPFTAQELLKRVSQHIGSVA